MRYLLTVCFLALVLSVFGQEWRTTVSSARNAYKQGDFERAVRLYQSAEKQEIKHTNLSTETGQAAYRSNDFNSAQKYFERAANTPNKNLSAGQFYNLGNSLMKQKKYPEAISAYKKALKLIPNDKQTQYNLSEAIRKNNQKSKNSPDQQKNNQPPPQPKNDNQKQQPPKTDPGKNENKIPSKSADRLLDQLMKAEAETKRKLAGSRQKGSGQQSGKDW
jgi:tetratricopeptide (TPR) repeat protein